jgi:hypothetical protein
LAIDGSCTLFCTGTITGVEVVDNGDADRGTGLDERNVGIWDVALERDLKFSIVVRGVVPGLKAMIKGVIEVRWVEMGLLPELGRICIVSNSRAHLHGSGK